MNDFLTQRLIAVWLLSTLVFSLQSCDDGSPQLEKSKVQFSLSPGTSPPGRAQFSDLPDDARLIMNVENSSGELVFTDQEFRVRKSEAGYTTDPLELMPGNYVITDFMVVDDSQVLNATPRNKSPLSEFVTHSLPYNFAVAGNNVARVSMQVINARNEKPEAFGYSEFKANKAKTLSFIVSRTGGKGSFEDATAELRQGKSLLKTFPVGPGMNKVIIDGNADAMYSLVVYAGDAAKVTSFNFKELREEHGEKPLKITLEPALLLTIESSIDENNEYEEYFEFALEGAGGKVNINWGDGHEDEWTLPFTGYHEYTAGSYTAIITGDIDQITTFYGFAYSTIMYAIDGLTNLTGLKTYNPSWGAVPIKVDLSNCKKLETIHIEKYGAPYEPIDLRTEFKLPTEHSIRQFVFFVPSLDPGREFISPDEFEVLINNIYNNTVRRDIEAGQFFVYPVDAWSPAAAEKMETLQSDYHWDVRLDGNIWEDFSENGRTHQDMDARRERWLKEKFAGNKRVLREAGAIMVN